MMNKNVDNYFVEGCGRCPLGGTPQCKVHSWAQELDLLRAILQESELKEESKWGVPCYTYQGENVLILSAFKEYCCLSFFKGALLKDPYKILSKQGENTYAARLILFTHVQEIQKLTSQIKSTISEAIEVEKSGLKLPAKEYTAKDFVNELQQKLEEDPSFKSAFEALTPGRQRGYNLYFSQAKQSVTRFSRIEKSMIKIFEGKGWNER
ncbi:YdeI/OmpD-associated family protein [Algoriphagus halophilus]|nr:DUF1801 domain-containing protein [Algoriphagus halophilus]